MLPSERAAAASLHAFCFVFTLLFCSEDRANPELGGGKSGGGWRLLPRTFLLTLGLNDDILMHRSPAGSAKGEQHLADDMATSETSLKYISSTGRKMEKELAPFSGFNSSRRCAYVRLDVRNSQVGVGEGEKVSGY